MNILNAVRLFLLCVVLVFSGPQARANVSGVNGIDGSESSPVCITNGIYQIPKSDVQGRFWAPCNLDSNLYVPHTGNYSVAIRVFSSTGAPTNSIAMSSVAQFDGSKTITNQNITVVPAGNSTYPHDKGYYACQFLVDDASDIWYALSSNPVCNYSAQPLPPTPAPPDTACTLNGGNALDVNLSIVDRDKLPTVPGSGSMRHIPVAVDCTGGDVTVNMQLNYTPIVFSAGQVIKSSTNGLGVSVVYNSKLLSNTDITPVAFLEGSNSIDLAFQAVRDPTVEIKDIPTGAFTASAVLVMTQQ